MSNISNNIKNLIQNELSGLFNHIVNVSENTEGFVITKESLIKISDDYFSFSEAATKKGKAIKATKTVKEPKEKKEIPEEERCISTKKDGSRCNGRKTKKEEHKNTGYEELCSLHINMALKESLKPKEPEPENDLIEKEEF